MSTTPIEAIGATNELGNEGPGRAVENPGALLDRDAFLKLLVAQLKYQDPSKPADASQMLAQSAQLTMVDRLNELTDAYQASAASQRLSLAGTIVGRDITFVDAEGNELTATVQSASVENEELTLVAGGYSVPFGAIVSVHAPAVAPAALPYGSPPYGSTPTATGTTEPTGTGTTEPTGTGTTEPTATGTTEPTGTTVSNATATTVSNATDVVPGVPGAEDVIEGGAVDDPAEPSEPTEGEAA